MAAFDSIFKLSIGSSGFQLEDYAYREEPIVKEGTGRTGTRAELSGEGWVEAASAAAFSTALAAAALSFGTSGQNVTVTGLSGVTEVSLLAAQCIDGGPHVAFEMLPQMPESPLVKRFRFNAVAVRNTGVGGGGGGDPANSYSITISTRADGLRQVRIEGELRGAGVSNYFTGTVQPLFDGLYPVNFWVPAREIKFNATDDQASYSLQYTELAEPLPVSASGADRAVDGEVIESTERDEQMRLILVISFDLLIDGDPVKVRDAMRAGLVSPPLSERTAITTHQGVKLTGEFRILRGGNGNDLMDWNQTLETLEESTGLAALETPVGNPVLYVRERRALVYVQQGRAIGAGRFPKPPDPIYPRENMENEPVIRFEQLNEVEHLTTWEYRFIFETAQVQLAAKLALLRRPAVPTFYDTAGGG